MLKKVGPEKIFVLLNCKLTTKFQLSRSQSLIPSVMLEHLGTKLCWSTIINVIQ